MPSIPLVTPVAAAFGEPFPVEIVVPLVGVSSVVLKSVPVGQLSLTVTPAVAAAVAQLLDHRYSEELPTLLTAAYPPEAMDRRENHPLVRLEDGSLFERLRGAEGVEMVPALRPWIYRIERS